MAKKALRALGLLRIELVNGQWPIPWVQSRGPLAETQQQRLNAPFLKLQVEKLREADRTGRRIWADHCIHHNFVTLP